MTHLLELQQVSKAFGGVRVLNDIDLSIEPGGIVGLIGPNGAGKSTLVNVLAGVYHADRGKLRFRGRDMRRLSAADRARMGLVRTFQRAKPIFDLTCIDSVVIGGLSRGLSVRAARTEALSVLGLLGLGDHANDSPAVLSAAVLKLLDLARVLMLHPSMVWTALGLVEAPPLGALT